MTRRVQFAPREAKAPAALEWIFGLGEPCRVAMAPEEEAGAADCWPCTAVNLAAGLLVGGLPLVLVWPGGNAIQRGLGLAWAVAVLAFTGYRILAKGYLPGAEWLARRSGLHEVIGPGSQAPPEGGSEEP